eukprot:TRINITY_DN11142_c0_g1_i1.p1 TRINITY_DN11142_c0_g1~~TRINITY_DN11142_c0_g1_i1.p1  ORF type:complete len:672 (-),score=169.49 TRINITY_DN11142_c0_g1_i1:94-2109(-)
MNQKESRLEINHSINSSMRTIDEERKRASFNSRELSFIIEGKEETLRREKIYQLIQRDKILFTPNFFELNVDEQKFITAKKLIRGHEVLTKMTSDEQKSWFHVMNLYDDSYSMRSYVHYVLFRETIMVQGSDEQWKEWKDDIEKLRVIGCFSMTELGHSSYLRGLETTATYDPNTEEFIINTPTLTATKWWIGMSGQTATHTLVLAQLIIEGENKGLFWFITPLRDRHTGKLLPRVSAGDVGPKVSRNGLDNGWIQFNDVRVPRKAMLSKWAQVEKDGTFIPPKDLAISYATLIGERIYAVLGSYSNLAKAVIIATRYSVLRKQGPNETSVIDFQIQLNRLIPTICGSLIMKIVGDNVMRRWEQIIKLSQSKDTMKEFLVKSKDYHGISSALKTWLAYYTVDGLEHCRRAMGGHAYSSYNSIGDIINVFNVITTGGGDNTVLGQQCSAYLLSTFRRALEGKTIDSDSSVYFFSKFSQILESKRKLMDFNVDEINYSSQNLIENILEIYQYATIVITKETAEEMMLSSQKNGTSNEAVWNDFQVQLMDCSKLFAFYFTIKEFSDHVSSIQNSQNISVEIKNLFRKVLFVFALSSIQDHLKHFYEFDCINKVQAKSVQNLLFNFCKELRYDAIALTDSFNIPDMCLKSPLGCYAGDIYTRYFVMLENGRWSTG